MKTQINREILSDGSEVFNVYLSDDYFSALKFGAITEADACEFVTGLHVLFDIHTVETLEEIG